MCVFAIDVVVVDAIPFLESEIALQFTTKQKKNAQIKRLEKMLGDRKRCYTNSKLIIVHNLKCV